MSEVPAKQITAAKLEAHEARRRLMATLGVLQQRLQPGNLATQAWSGLKEKSGEIADDAVEAVKHRPAIASGVAAAIMLFLAREPIMSAASRLVNGKESKEKKKSKRRAPSRTASEDGTARKNEGVSA
jgi:ElaB/YqjD/DUF883 family membrane-anchored ribosome-binding protein